MSEDNANEITDLVTNTDKSIEWTDNSDSAKALATATKRRRQIKFLQAFQEGGTIRSACEATGLNSTTVRSWRENDEWFQKQYVEAEQNYRDLVEQEVHNRAIVGEQVPIVGKVATPAGTEDQIIGYKTVKSDLLLMFHAKRHIREYRDKYTPDADNGNKPVRESPMVQINVLIDRIAEKVGMLPLANNAQLPPATADVIDISSDDVTEVK